MTAGPRFLTVRWCGRAAGVCQLTADIGPCAVGQPLRTTGEHRVTPSRDRGEASASSRTTRSTLRAVISCRMSPCQPADAIKLRSVALRCGSLPSDCESAT